MSRYVLPSKFEEQTGYTVKAQQRKREEGVWRLNKEYIKAPDGRILMDIRGYEAWVESQQQVQ